MVQQTAENWDFNIPFTTRGERGGGGVLIITAYTGRRRAKGYLFQASGISKGREFCPLTHPLGLH